MSSKTRTSLALFVFLLVPLVANGKEVSCSNLPSCPGGTKEIKLCVIDPDVVASKWNLLMRLIEHNNCEGEGRRDIVVSSPSGLKDIFREALAKCERIKDLRFTGHGAPGYTAAGRVTTANVSSLRELNCAMAPLATIDILGCNTGRGCMGQLFMYTVAKNLLPQGGDVIGTTYYATVVLPRPKHISLDGTRRILQLRPGSKESEKWLLDSPTRIRQTPAGESCTSEIDEALATIENHDKFTAVSKTCQIPENGDVRETARLLKQRRDSILKIDKSHNVFGPIAEATTGDWYQGKLGSFTGISDAALRLVEEMQPYLACRRKQMSGRLQAVPTQQRQGETAQ